MTETVNVTEGCSEIPPSYEKKKENWKFKRSVERMPGIEMSERYVLRDEILITTNEMPQAADVSVHWSSLASFASELVKIFKVSSVKFDLVLMHKVDAEWGRNAPDTKLR